MLMYELMTLHIPYENLNAQQANQANERGTRPPLTKKVLDLFDKHCIQTYIPLSRL